MLTSRGRIGSTYHLTINDRFHLSKLFITIVEIYMEYLLLGVHCNIRHITCNEANTRAPFDKGVIYKSIVPVFWRTGLYRHITILNIFHHLNTIIPIIPGDIISVSDSCEHRNICDISRNIC